jgi:hypothetical protein
MRWNENWIIMQKFRKPHLAKVNSTCLTLTLTYGDFNVLMLTYFKKKNMMRKKKTLIKSWFIKNYYYYYYYIISKTNNFISSKFSKLH